MISIISFKGMNSSRLAALILFTLVLAESYYRTQIWITFEFKQHKATLKKIQGERSAWDKILGLYTSKYSLAPCHMRRYKISRIIAFAGYMSLLLLLALFPAKWTYIFDAYLIWSVPILVTMIVDWIILCFPNKLPDYDRSKRP